MSQIGFSVWGLELCGFTTGSKGFNTCGGSVIPRMTWSHITGKTLCQTQQPFITLDIPPLPTRVVDAVFQYCNGRIARLAWATRSCSSGKSPLSPLTMWIIITSGPSRLTEEILLHSKAPTPRNYTVLFGVQVVQACNPQHLPPLQISQPPETENEILSLIVSGSFTTIQTSMHS